MKNKYKHSSGYGRKKHRGFFRFLTKVFVYLCVILAVFIFSDRIAALKAQVVETINNSYSFSYLKKLKDRAASSSKEIKEAVAVFKEQKQADEETDTSDVIVFRPPYMGEITSVYGEREHPVGKESSFHTGIDIAGNEGDTIISSASGRVTRVGYDETNGHYLIIEHNDKFSTSYGHLSKVSVIEGENVDSNTKIGEMGSSGLSTGAHLHFCIFEEGETIDPEIYVKLDHRE